MLSRATSLNRVLILRKFALDRIQSGISRNLQAEFARLDLLEARTAMDNRLSLPSHEVRLAMPVLHDAVRLSCEVLPESNRDRLVVLDGLRSDIAQAVRRVGVRDVPAYNGRAKARQRPASSAEIAPRPPKQRRII